MHNVQRNAESTTLLYQPHIKVRLSVRTKGAQKRDEKRGSLEFGCDIVLIPLTKTPRLKCFRDRLKCAGCRNDRDKSILSVKVFREPDIDISLWVELSLWNEEGIVEGSVCAERTGCARRNNRQSNHQIQRGNFYSSLQHTDKPFPFHDSRYWLYSLVFETPSSGAHSRVSDIIFINRIIIITDNYSHLN